MPQRPTKVEGRKQEYYLTRAMRCSDDFEEGEIVWSATHHAPAVIDKKLTKEYQDSKMWITNSRLYKIISMDVIAIVFMFDKNQVQKRIMGNARHWRLSCICFGL